MSLQEFKEGMWLCVRIRVLQKFPIVSIDLLYFVFFFEVKNKLLTVDLEKQNISQQSLKWYILFRLVKTILVWNESTNFVKVLFQTLIQWVPRMYKIT